MPIPEAVVLRVRINGGAWQTGPVEGGITVAANDSIELSIANTSGVSQYRFEIQDYPPGVALPTGWTQQAGSRTRYSTSATPTAFTIPATAGLFGRWILGVTVNAGKRRGTNGYIAAPELTDNSIGLNKPSATGLWDTPLTETNQFSSTLQGGIDAHKNNLRVLENAGLSGGAANPTGGANQGSGVGVFKNKTTGPDTLNFKTLIQSTDAKLTFTAVGANEVRADYNAAHLLALAGGTMTGPIAMGTSKVTGAGEPTAAQDVATKNYVDNKFASLLAGLGGVAGMAPTAIYLGDDAPASGAFNTWTARNGAASLTATGNPQAGTDWGGSRTVNMDGTGDRYNVNGLATVHSSNAALAWTVLVPFVVTAGTTERIIVSISKSSNDLTNKTIKLQATSKFLRFFIQNDGGSSAATATGAVAFPEGTRCILGLTFSGSNVTASVKTSAGYVVHLNSVAMSAVTGAFTPDRFTIGATEGTGSLRELAAKWRGFAMWSGHSVSADRLKDMVDYFEYALGAELSGDTNFRTLSDTFPSFVGNALKVVRVNAAETALEPTAGGTDSTAIHDDTAAEISIVTESTQAEHGDVFIGESAGASPAFSKRRYTGETLANLGALGLTDAAGFAPTELWTGDDVSFTNGNLNTTVTFRRAQGTWTTSGSPPTSLDWLGARPVVWMDTADRFTTTTAALMTPHLGAPNGNSFSLMIAFTLRADGAGAERTLWSMQNSANEAGSRKRLYITTGGVLKYESRDSTGTVRDDLGATVIPTDTELIVAMSVAAAGNVTMSYADANNEVLLVVGTAASGSGTLTGLDTMSVGGALVSGVTAACLKGYVRAFAYWGTSSFTSARSYRVLRAAKYFAPVSGVDGGGGGGTVDPLVLTEVANGAAPALIAGKTILWAAASGQLFYRKDSGEIIGL